MEVIVMTIVERAIKWMEDTANDDQHGYDQDDRWGLYGDYDCSSAVITAWESAGVPVKTHGATYTGNMYKIFIECGFVDVTSSVCLGNGNGLKRGDVLLNHKNHTAMYCGNGKEVEASINEFGDIRGGSSGDQTGREFLIRDYRNYPWDCVLRYIDDGLYEKGVSQLTEHVHRGSKGDCVREVQDLLNVHGYKCKIDGDFGPETEICVRQFQGDHYLKVDGDVGPITFAALRQLDSYIETIAKEVIEGKWGDGEDRLNRLTAAGYDYKAVQQCVNELLK